MQKKPTKTSKITVYLIAIYEIIKLLITDLIHALMASNKKYHGLIITFIFLLANSFLPIYYILTGDLSKIYNKGAFNTESGEYITYYDSLVGATIIFGITIIYFLIKQFLTHKREFEDFYIEEDTRKELDYLLETYTIEDKEDKEEHSNLT